MGEMGPKPPMPNDDLTERLGELAHTICEEQKLSRLESRKAKIPQEVLDSYATLELELGDRLTYLK